MTEYVIIIIFIRIITFLVFLGPFLIHKYLNDLGAMILEIFFDIQSGKRSHKKENKRDISMPL